VSESKEVPYTASANTPLMPLTLLHQYTLACNTHCLIITDHLIINPSSN